MNRKRIRQMNTALLRRLTGRPTAEYFSGQPLLERLESENYIQRFAPLYDGTRLRCGDVLELCRPELAELSGGEPEGGWLHFAYDFARRQLFPEKEAPAAYDAGAVFFLSLLQVLFAAEREKLPFDPAWDFDFLSETEAAECACGASEMLGNIASDTGDSCDAADNLSEIEGIYAGSRRYVDRTY